MATITIRLDDQKRVALEAVARGRGETVSDLLRYAADEILGTHYDAAPTSGPWSLTLAERSVLTSQHKILAALNATDEDCERKQHLKVVEVLTNGFTGEYDSVFAGFDPEISRRECRLVWDLLDMFRVLRFSLERLDEEEIAEIGEYVELALSFKGFDGNDAVEARLMRYARFLVDDGRWDEQAKVFEKDRGNSHSPMLGSYRRMLAAFETIWDRKTRDHSKSFDDRLHLDVEELKVVYAAWPHPHR